MSSFFHSIRWRLQIWHGLILLMMVVSFCVVAFQFYWNNQLRRIDQEIKMMERRVIRGLLQTTDESPDALVLSFTERLRMGKLPDSVRESLEGNAPGFFYFSIRDTKEEVLQQSDNIPESLYFLLVPEEDLTEEMRTTNSRREYARSSRQRDGAIQSIFGRDIRPELEERRRFGWSLAGLGAIVWSVGLLGGWWLAGRAMLPVKEIGRAASRIAAGDLEERINTQGGDSELDQLGRVLNETFERLLAAFQRQRRFTADASHELRTPVTIILSETQRLLKRPRSDEEYAEGLRTCRDAANRMHGLIETLLLLARQEDYILEHKKTICDLAKIAESIVRSLSALAQKKDISIHKNLATAECQGDLQALSILVNNLLVNAIQYTSEHGNIWIETMLENGRCILSVRDDGCGIEKENLSHIFERFYRVDQARAAESGNTGLGLAIAETIVRNHEGTIAVDSIAGKGSCFTVRI